jgi:hypothetical protein
MRAAAIGAAFILQRFRAFPRARKDRWWLLFSIFLAAQSFAAAPPLDGFYPAGGERGMTGIVAAMGKFDAWPPKVWMDQPGVAFTAETNKGKFRVNIAADAAPGPRLIRFYNEEGASEPKFFVIGATREIGESEPNNHFAKAQQVSELPITINGRLEKNGDTDSFAIQLRAGQWLDARVDSYRLMSKVDAALRLVDTNGQQLAWNHDFITLDPRLVWRAPTDATVVLQLFGWAYPPGSDIGFTGGEAVVYRLHVVVTNSAPGKCDSSTEKEPNDTAKSSGLIETPAVVRGIIHSGTDEDRFRFSAAKGETVEARLEAASFGSPLDAWVAIEDSTGQQLARNDDADGSRDPRLEWKAPTNGNFIVAVGSLTHRGGDDYCYLLSLHKVEADYSATLAANSLVLTRGGTNELKIDLKRLRGYTNELTVQFRDLPEGVTVLTTNLPRVPASNQPSKDGAVAIKFSTALDAPKFQGPVRLLLIDGERKTRRTVPFELITRGETGFNHLLLDTADALWMTVRPKPEPEKKATAKKEI